MSSNYAQNVVSNIVQKDLCTSCGACKQICPNKNIKICYNKKQKKWYPFILDTSKCVLCKSQKNCLAVCPSYQSLQNNRTKKLSKIVGIYTGYSSDNNVRYQASSGGYVRLLCKQLLKQNEIDGVIALRHVTGIEYIPSLYRSEKKLDEMPNSIYHSVNFANALQIIKNIDGKFAIVGLPCQIDSISKFLEQERNKKYRKRVYLKISLICGYTRERKNIYAYAALNKQKLNHVEYRIGGKYKKFRINHTYISDSKHPRTEKERIVNKMLLQDNSTVCGSCLICKNHLGNTADIVVGDAWLKKYNNDNMGSNIIIVRTKIGQENYNKIENYRFVQSSVQEIVESQGKYAYDLTRNNAEGENYRNYFKKYIIRNLIMNNHYKIALCLYRLYERYFEKEVG